MPPGSLLRDNGPLALMGLEAALEVDPPGAEADATAALAQPTCWRSGVLLQGWLAGAPALDEPDIGAALARLAGGAASRAPARLARSGRTHPMPSSAGCGRSTRAARSGRGGAKPERPRRRAATGALWRWMRSRASMGRSSPDWKAPVRQRMLRTTGR
jgi:hypothetical protein